MKSRKKRRIAAGVGAGLALAAAAVAGTYFFSGARGAKNRKKVKEWATKAKRDVVKRIRTLKKLNRGAYHKAVQEVMRRYKDLKDVNPKEIDAVVRELKGHWNRISRQVGAIPLRRSTRKKGKKAKKNRRRKKK